jgi:hypothetical protein
MLRLLLEEQTFRLRGGALNSNLLKLQSSILIVLNFPIILPERHFNDNRMYWKGIIIFFLRNKSLLHLT